MVLVRLLGVASLTLLLRKQSQSTLPVSLVLTIFVLHALSKLGLRCRSCVGGSAGAGHPMVLCPLHIDRVWFSLCMHVCMFVGVSEDILAGVSSFFLPCKY